MKALEDGKPKIVVLRFDKATVPSFLRTRRYISIERQELGTIVNEIMHSTGISNSFTSLNPEPYATLDFHDALVDGKVIYVVASRRDVLDVDPFYDPEAIEFARRDLYVMQLDQESGSIKYHHLSKARPAHTAMRVIGSHLLIFINDKVANQEFAMVGRMFRLDTNTMQPKAVDEIFAGQNWGWDPWIDEYGNLHHKDSETPGNPYRIGNSVAHDKTWHELAEIQQQWREAHCPFEVAYGPGRETGYLRFLDVDPSIFKK